jgi:hypothetical protein
MVSPMTVIVVVVVMLLLLVMAVRSEGPVGFYRKEERKAGLFHLPFGWMVMTMMGAVVVENHRC